MDAEKPDEQWPQFSVRTMLLWIAACSAPLGILQALLPKAVILLYIVGLALLLGLAFTFAIAASKSTKCGLTPRPRLSTLKDNKSRLAAAAIFAASVLALWMAVCLAVVALRSLEPGSQ